MAMNEMNGDRLALITGASAGLGLALSHFLAAQGVELIITARGSQQLQDVQYQLQDFDAEVVIIPGDIQEPDHRQSLFDMIEGRGGLDILVNNASTLGQTPMPLLVDYDLNELRRAFETNTLGPLALVQLMHNHLSRRSGLVVNISSDAALGGYQGWGGYGASKAALDLISLTLANELKDTGISVVSVDPGDMQTAMHQRANPGADISGLPLPEATLPFWAWLFGQDPANLSGRRFAAQAQLWEVPA